MNRISIDVLLPVGLNSPHLKEAIESILSQDFTNWKLFILIDVGNPSTKLIKSLVPSAKLKIVEFEETFNLSKRLNSGMKLGSSKYIARMDADDVSHKNRFSAQAQFLQSTGFSLIGSSALVINEAGNSISNIRVTASINDIKRNLLRKNQFLHPTLMFRRDVIQNVQYNPLLSYAQDYGFILEVARIFEISNIAENLLSYRIHDANHSNKRISFDEMKIIGKLKFELSTDLGASQLSYIFWHLLWVIKNVFFSLITSLNLRLVLRRFSGRKLRFE